MHVEYYLSLQVLLKHDVQKQGLEERIYRTSSAPLTYIASDKTNFLHPGRENMM